MIESQQVASTNGERLDPVAPARKEPLRRTEAESARPAPSTGPEDVIIFVPGVGQSESVQLPHVAELLCWELNLQAPNRTATFTSKPTSVGGEVVHRIQRTDKSGDVVGVLDVYGYDLVAELDRNTTPTNPLWRVLSLGLTVFTTVLVLIGVMVNPNRKHKPTGQLLQVLVVMVMVLFIIIYFAIAVIALIQAIATILQGDSAEPVLSWPQWIVLIGAVVGGLVPTVRDRINWLGERSVQMARFTHTAALRNRLSGGILDLLDRVTQRPEIKRVHVVGYSFGSLAAIEAIYPQGGRPGEAVKLIDTLTTIGSPFDIVCMVRPNYREGRTLDGVKPNWLNIYQPIDVLGSNFRTYDKKGKEIDYGLITEDQKTTRTPDSNQQWDPDLKLSLVNLLMLRSLSVHAGYWDDNTTARNALGLVVANLTSRHPRLLGEKPHHDRERAD